MSVLRRVCDRDGILKRKTRRCEYLQQKKHSSPTKSLTRPKLTQKNFRLLGILPLAFFIAQASHYLQIHQFGNVLWLCNIGNLMLAIGMILQQSRLIRVAVFWMFPGVLVWLIYVVPTWGMVLTGFFNYTDFFGVISSTLAHVGGFGVGIIALRRVGVEKLTWLHAFAWCVLMQLVSRLLTSPDLNVNVSQAVQAGWQITFSSYWKFWLVLSACIAVCLWALGLLLNHLWPASEAAGPR